MVKQTQSQATKVRKARNALKVRNALRKTKEALKVRNALRKSKEALKVRRAKRSKKTSKKASKKELTNPNKSFLSNENKNFINSMFSVKIMQLIHQIPNFTFDNCFVGAFDGMERKTANTLISMGFQQSAILLNELNETVARSHLSAGFPVHEGVDFGSDKYDKLYKEDGQAWRVYKCLGWYFDTCGEIGTQKQSLLSSIKKLVLIDGSVLAFTFCRSRMSVEEYAKDKRLFMKLLSAVMSNCGLKIKVDYDHDYAGSLMFKRARESHMNSFICTVVSNK
jgi:hypothetical protein